MNDNKIYDICIIGAGASGLVAAIESSRRGLSCVVVDKNKKAGRKLYATGNGRCNLTNDTWEEDTYYGNEFVDNVFEKLYRFTDLRPRSFVIDYMRRLGIQTINKDGYFYPSSLQASSVVWALVDAASSYGTRFLYKSLCTSVNKVSVDEMLTFTSHITDDILDNQGIYKINVTTRHDDEEIEGYILAKGIIVATGGLSKKTLGSATADDTYRLFNSLRIPFVEYSSGLCPVYVTEDLSSLEGVRTKARLKVDGHTEVGEIQLSAEGISGIVTFNMSYYMKPGADVIVNLLPKIDEDSFADSFNKMKQSFPDRRLDLFLNGYVNDKLGAYMMKKFYGNQELILTLKDVTETGIRGIYQEMTEWRLSIRGRAGLEDSQASIGGILTKYIDPYNMTILPAVTLGSNICATGESTDVIGKCGGYNLTYAFITGYLAGNNIFR
ncbi:hypothetical protein SAMN02910369_02073 [Lachnospiraceae bacterium NE2001]|nr:hypothetical protein SAMN02910369_02073 [Lachnospiraceae bacterium NE2001]